MIGIYCIKNVVNNKVYVGQSRNIESRWNDHRAELKNNTHYNHNLQQDWNFFGENNFQFQIIEQCSLDVLNIREEFWIDTYKRLKLVYNKFTSNYGKGNRKLNSIRKEEIKELFIANENADIAAIAKLYGVGTTTIYNIRRELGIKPKKVVTQEQKEAISDKLKGRKLSEEHRKNVQDAIQKAHGYSKYTEEQIKEIIALLMQGLTNKEIEKLTNVSYTVINNVRNRKSWTELTKGLDIPNVKCKNQYSK